MVLWRLRRMLVVCCGGWLGESSRERQLVRNTYRASDMLKVLFGGWYECWRVCLMFELMVDAGMDTDWRMRCLFICIDSTW